jgi:hypothetical protein
VRGKYLENVAKNAEECGKLESVKKLPFITRNIFMPINEFFKPIQ